MKEVAEDSIMSSRERMLAALNCRKSDHVPCRIEIPCPHGIKFADAFAGWDWQLKQGVDVDFGRGWSQIVMEERLERKREFVENRERTCRQ